MGGISITNIEYFLPEGCITNEDLAAKFGSNPDETFKKTGVRKRFHTHIDFIMSDMAFEAAEKIFAKTPELREKIDALILVGHGYDYKAPITSALLQNRLGLSKNCLAIDMPHGCSGYMNGLGVSKGLLYGGLAKTILLMTGDTPSYVIHPENEELLAIFGDSATASIISLKEGVENQFIYGTDGAGAESLMVKRSSSRKAATADWLNETGLLNGQMEMKSTEIFTFALRTVLPLTKDILEKNQVTLADIDFVVFHQANTFLLEVLRKRLKIEKEKFFNDIENTGNTVASSIPIALKTAEERGQLKRGMKVLLAGFGLGYTWGATVIEY
ncbi:MAG: ketoacyl-ACP synthase III [Bacteroidia bacterium]|nr:ketoacyl-ACP synthase III [Bacteroidia bacterium]